MPPTTDSKIYKVARPSLKLYYSASFGNIKPIILRKVKSIIRPLVYVINLSLSCSIVPDQVKIAKVINIYPNCDPVASDNYL